MFTVDDAPDTCDVLVGVEEVAVGGFAVAAGPARLLVVALDRLGQRKVDDEAYIRLVDAHAEGDRGAHNLRAITKSS